MSNQGKSSDKEHKPSGSENKTLVMFCGRLTIGTLSGYLWGKLYKNSIWYGGMSILLLGTLHYMDWI